MRAYQTLARLLEYPGADFHLQLSRCQQLLNSICPEALTPLRDFNRQMSAITINEAQERYTRTFDLNPACAMEIGYHLFGENYKRGLFLAQLMEMESGLELGQQQQLPDYLPVLLRLVDRLAQSDVRGELIAECLVPALQKMIEASAESPYRHLLEAVLATVEFDVNGFQCSQPEREARSFYV